MTKANKVKQPNIIRGGIAIPLGRNYYYMSGRKHENGGIDIGKNPRTGLEVEDGEVMHIGQNNVEVFSAQPFLNGKSPAQRVIDGENPTKVFKAQESYKDRNKINDDGTRKKKMGGLSRSKDYGSKSKPYPNVKKSDFAGGGRSYPIPTKTDAVDALRLAGLHHRLDVKAKVYRKYPELRKKAKTGGLYSLTVGGVTKLMPYPSTGQVKKSKTTKLIERSKFAKGGNTKDNDKIKIVTTDIISDTNPFTITENITPTSSTENVEAITNTSVPRAFAKRNRNITDPEKLNIAYQKESSTYPNWFQRTYKNIRNYVRENPGIVEDAIGLTSNITSSLIGHGINRGMLNSLKYSSAPIPQRATKLKTRININPQLDKMRESLAAYERAVDANTASSRVALARKQRARLANVLSTNELYGDKENKETALINQDRLNQQEVANRNIDSYNAWAQGKTDFENSIRQQKAENNIALINNLNAGIQNVINNIQQRRTEGRNIRATLLAYPNLPVEQLLTSGLITQEEYNTYRKGYPLKRKKNNNND